MPYNKTQNFLLLIIYLYSLTLLFDYHKYVLFPIIDHFYNRLPVVNTVRAADFIFEDDKVSGTYVFTFPLNEYDN